MPTYKTFCGASLLLSTQDVGAAIRRAYECMESSPASAITIEKDGEEMTIYEIEMLSDAAFAGMSLSA